MLCFLLILVVSVLSVPRRCDRAQDCVSFGSFCHGPVVCNSTAYCVAKDPFYDPCREIRLLYERTVAPEYTISFLCIEELRECVEVYYCVTDEDCDCTKKEQCLDGQCRPCDKECLECDPVLQRAREINDAAIATAESNPVTIYIVTGAVVLLLLLGVCVALGTICKTIRRKTNDAFYS